MCAAGTDASQFDPNGRMCVTGEGFHRIGTTLRAAAEDLGIASLAVIQEGGYGRTYGAVGTVAALLGLLGRANAVADPIAYLPDEGDAHVPALAAARAAWEHGPHARGA